VSSARFHAVIATHLKGRSTAPGHAVVPMKETGYGRIINITSSAGSGVTSARPITPAAKAGVMGMTFVWAMELGRSASR